MSPRRPVIYQAQAEDVLLGFGDVDRLSELIAGSDKPADLELVIEHFARAKG
jgi:hypothetical protein